MSDYYQYQDRKLIVRSIYKTGAVCRDAATNELVVLEGEEDLKCTRKL
jgi:hypothetical protein